MNPEPHQQGKRPWELTFSNFLIISDGGSQAKTLVVINPPLDAALFLDRAGQGISLMSFSFAKWLKWRKEKKMENFAL